MLLSVELAETPLRRSCLVGCLECRGVYFELTEKNVTKFPKIMREVFGSEWDKIFVFETTFILESDGTHRLFFQISGTIQD
jgi:hypothetical protein